MQFNSIYLIHFKNWSCRHIKKILLKKHLTLFTKHANRQLILHRWLAMLALACLRGPPLTDTIQTCSGVEAL